jgi:hypothetical protein
MFRRHMLVSFRVFSLVGNGQEGFNHRHKDSGDVMGGIILTLSSDNCSISKSQGMTVYYPCGYTFGTTMCVCHEHGRLLYRLALTNQLSMLGRSGEKGGL